MGHFKRGSIFTNEHCCDRMYLYISIYADFTNTIMIKLAIKGEQKQWKIMNYNQMKSFCMKE